MSDELVERLTHINRFLDQGIRRADAAERHPPSIRPLPHRDQVDQEPPP